MLYKQGIKKRLKLELQTFLYLVTESIYTLTRLYILNNSLTQPLTGELYS